MTSYTYEETAFETEHQETDEATEEAQRALVEALLAAELEADKALAADLLKLQQICSCGYHTCGAIGIYGHPVPVYQAEIEPLPGQSTKDRKALELKGAQS